MPSAMIWLELYLPVDIIMLTIVHVLPLNAKCTLKFNYKLIGPWTDKHKKFLRVKFFDYILSIRARHCHVNVQYFNVHDGGLWWEIFLLITDPSQTQHNFYHQDYLLYFLLQPSMGQDKSPSQVSFDLNHWTINCKVRWKFIFYNSDLCLRRSSKPNHGQRYGSLDVTTIVPSKPEINWGKKLFSLTFIADHLF